MEKSTTAFRLNLDDQTKTSLQSIAEQITEKLGIEVNMTWVLRTLISIIANPQITSPVRPAEAILVKMMLQSCGNYTRS